MTTDDNDDADDNKGDNDDEGDDDDDDVEDGDHNDDSDGNNDERAWRRRRVKIAGGWWGVWPLSWSSGRSPLKWSAKMGLWVGFGQLQLNSMLFNTWQF